MKHTMSKLLACLLSFTMIFSSLPITVLAEGISTLLPEAPVNVEPVVGDEDAPVVDYSAPFSFGAAMPIALDDGLTLSIEAVITDRDGNVRTDNVALYNENISFRVTVDKPWAADPSATVTKYTVDGIFEVDGTRPEEGEEDYSAVRLERFKRVEGPDGLGYNTSERPSTLSSYSGGTIVFETNGAYLTQQADMTKWVKSTFIITEITGVDDSGNNVYGEKYTAEMLVYVSDKGNLTFGYSMAVGNTDFPSRDKTYIGKAYNPGYHSGQVNKGMQDSYRLTDGVEIMENGVTSGDRAQKYLHTQLYAPGEEIRITSVVPRHNTDKGYAFVAWVNKTNGKDGNRGESTWDKLYNPGDKLLRSNVNNNDHTVDAIWTHISAKNNVVIYDGKGHCILDPVLLLDAEKHDSYYAGGVFDDIINTITQNPSAFTYTVTGPDGEPMFEGERRYTLNKEVGEVDENGSRYTGNVYIEDLAKYTDVGQYTYTLKGEFVVNSGQSTRTATIEKTVTLTILPRPVVVEVNNYTTNYDGLPHTVASGAGNVTKFTGEYTIWGKDSDYVTNWLSAGLKAALVAKMASVDVEWDDEWDDLYNEQKGYAFAPGQSFTAQPDVKYKETGKTNADNKTEVGVYPAVVDNKDDLIVKDADTTARNYVIIDIPGTLTILGAKLKITKKLLDENGNPLNAPEDMDFTFNVTYANGTKSLAPVTVTVRKGQSQATSAEINVMPGVEYTVAEQTPPAGYELDSYSPASGKVTVPAEETREVIVTNKRLPATWKVTKTAVVYRDGKEVDVDNTNVKVKPGETIHYVIKVENTSSILPITKPVTDTFTVDGLPAAFDAPGFRFVPADSTEANVPKSDEGVTFDGEKVTIPAGKTAYFVAEYTVQDDDKEIDNLIVVKDPDDPDDEDHEDDTETPVEDNPKWEITKVVNKTRANVNEELTYTITLTNTGNVNLNLQLTDTFNGNGGSGAYYNITLTIGDATTEYENWAQLVNAGVQLKVGESATITYNYKVSVDDVSPLKNTIKADDPTYCDPDDPDEKQDEHDEDHEDDAEVKIIYKPAFSLEKEVYDLYDTVNGKYHPATVAVAGDELTYEIKIKNTGTITLNALKLNDVFDMTVAKGTEPQPDWLSWTSDKNPTNVSFSTTDPEYDVVITGLAVGETITITYTYTVVEADRGTLTNIVTVTPDKTGYPEDTDLTDLKEQDDDTEVPVAHIDLQKDVNNKPASKLGWRAGEEVIFLITVTNDGAVTLYDVVVDDTLLLPADGSIEIQEPINGEYVKLSSTQALIEQMNPGDVVKIRVLYVMREDSEVIKNHAKAKGNTDPDQNPDENKTVEDEDDAETSSGTWDVVKQVYHLVDGQAVDAYPADDIDGQTVEVGDELIYIITVTNTGKIPLKNLRLTDIFKVNGDESNASLKWNNPDPTQLFDLGVEESIQFSATYTVLRADAKLHNLVIVDKVDDPDDPGTPPTEDEKDDWPNDEVDNDIPKWKVVKNASVVRNGETINVSGKKNDPDTHHAVYEGETITYTVEIENKGIVKIENLVIEDKLSSDKASLVYAGATSNLGNGRVPVLTDGTEAGTWLLSELLVGEKVTLTFTYTVQDGDRDLVNAVVTYREDGPEDDPDDPDHKDETETPVKDWTVVKTATVVRNGKTVDVSGKDAASQNAVFVDEVITYAIKVTNTGEATLDEVVVTDKFKGYTPELGDITAESDWDKVKGDSEEQAATADQTEAFPITIKNLKPGESVTLTYTYKVQEGDKKLNNVTTADDPEDPEDPDDPPSDETETPVKDWTIVKDATVERDGETINVSGKDAASRNAVYVGETVTYTIKVTNTGEVTLETLEVSDEFIDYKGKIGQITATSDWNDAAEAATVKSTDKFPITIENLKKGETVTFTYTYKVQEGDTKLNNVTAAKDPEDPDDPPSDKTETPVKDWTIVKTATVERNGKTVDVSGKDAASRNAVFEGETITYTIKVTNTGEATLDTVVVTDEFVGYQAKIGKITATSDWADAAEAATVNQTEAFPIEISNLKPGEAVTFTYTYTVQENDETLNNVTVATDPDEPEDPDNPPPSDETETPVERWKITKKATVARNGKTVDVSGKDAASRNAAYVGETIVYTVTVTNTGDSTIKLLTVYDKLIGYHNSAEAFKVASAPEGTTCAWSDGGFPLTIRNLPKDGVVVITYTYQVHEDDFTLRNVVTSWNPENPSNPEEPEDPDYPDDEDDDHSDETETPIAKYTAEKTLVTSLPTDEEGREIGFAAGDWVEFEITVTNTGAVTLTNIALEEMLEGAVFVANANAVPAYELVDAQGMATDANTSKYANIPELASLATATLKAKYQVTQADVDNGGNTNVVVVDPEDPELPPEEPEEDIPAEEPDPAIKVVKNTTNNPDHKRKFRLGETIEYSITVTNTGNVSLTDVKVEDELTGDVWTVASLAPGESRTFTTSHVVTEEDVLAGSVLNEVTAKGRRPHPNDPKNPDDPYDPDDPSDEDEVEDPTEETPEDPRPAIKVVKTTTNNPDHSRKFKLGETIEYSITVTNTGNVMLTDVKVEDELTGDVWTVASLAPGESKTFTTSHVVTEEDVLAGSVLNEVTAKARKPHPDDPENPVNPDDPYAPDDPTDEDDVEDPTENPNPHLTLLKETISTPANGYAYVYQETIRYRITATNDGNLTLYDVVVTDELTGDEWTAADWEAKAGGTWRDGMDATPGTLEPGETVVFTASHVVTRNDANRGSVLNTAVAKAKSNDPENPEVPANPSEVTDPTVPVTTTVRGTKVWVDNSNSKGLRPDSIEVILYANGVPTDEVPTWTKNGDTWSFVFSDLPYADESGKRIVYTVSESPVPEYTASYNGTTITNTLNPQYMSISGHKTWNDDDNAAGLRPESITVRLMRDGVVIDEMVVTEADNWSYTFADLPTSDPVTGIDYVYTVGEAAVSGYYTITKGYDLVNTLLPTAPSNPQSIARMKPNTAELEQMLRLFDYGTPLWGTLLKTGREVPAYPFIFGGMGVAALLLLAVLSRKKRKA